MLCLSNLEKKEAHKHTFEDRHKIYNEEFNEINYFSKFNFA